MFIGQKEEEEEIGAHRCLENFITTLLLVLIVAALVRQTQTSNS